ncbi:MULTISPECIES: hypothetical protein [Bradyrhizobium]|uniref:hypothetical protein n=1 Tax=Bradyrhizobium TaxID=374 RepID=UPI00048036E8|nr:MULTISPECIES: hypothetical protein [Bradyrhizobium]WLB88161.1 hypothetical protein QIH91_36915 [Bradyrhizobium japonicum USDA 135]
MAGTGVLFHPVVHTPHALLDAARLAAEWNRSACRGEAVHQAPETTADRTEDDRQAAPHAWAAKASTPIIGTVTSPPHRELAAAGAMVAAIDNKRACGSAIDLRANRQKCDCRFGGGHHMMQVIHDSDHA